MCSALRIAALNAAPAAAYAEAASAPETDLPIDMETIPMQTIFAAATPNGLKPVIAAEELGLPYRLVRVDLAAGDQKRPQYLEINPNGRIPALLDETDPEHPIRVFESGAILIHLSEAGRGLLPVGGSERAETLSWLFLQVAGLGPAFGQSGHFRNASEQVPYAIGRFRDEAERHMRVVEDQLARHEWLNGVSYSVADVAHFCWIRMSDYAGVSLRDAPHVTRWVDMISARPAVVRAINALASI